MSAYLSLYHDCWKMKKKENGMVITEIVNFNKEDSEAEVRVSDGDYSVECYVYPAEMSVFEKQSNVIDLKKNIKLTISLIATKLHKYVFNWPLIILYFIVGAVGLYFHEFIKERVEFINSTLVGYLGLLLSAIGILLSIYYGRKNK